MISTLRVRYKPIYVRWCMRSRSDFKTRFWVPNELACDKVHLLVLLFPLRASPCSPLQTLPGVVLVVLAPRPGGTHCFRFKVCCFSTRPPRCYRLTVTAVISVSRSCLQFTAPVSFRSWPTRGWSCDPTHLVESPHPKTWKMRSTCWGLHRLGVHGAFMNSRGAFSAFFSYELFTSVYIYDSRVVLSARSRTSMYQHVWIQVVRDFFFLRLQTEIFLLSSFLS